MATLAELGQKVKTKYPGQYDDMDDVSLAQKIQSKFPGQYDDFMETRAPSGPQPGPEWLLNQPHHQQSWETPEQYQSRVSTTNDAAKSTLMQRLGQSVAAFMGLPTVADVALGAGLGAAKAIPAGIKGAAIERPLTTGLLTALGHQVGGTIGAEVGGSLSALPEISAGAAQGAKQGVGIPARYGNSIGPEGISPVFKGVGGGPTVRFKPVDESTVVAPPPIKFRTADSFEPVAVPPVKFKPQQAETPKTYPPPPVRFKPVEEMELAGGTPEPVQGTGKSFGDFSGEGSAAAKTHSDTIKKYGNIAKHIKDTVSVDEVSALRKPDGSLIPGAQDKLNAWAKEGHPASRGPNHFNPAYFDDFVRMLKGLQ